MCKKMSTFTLEKVRIKKKFKIRLKKPLSGKKDFEQEPNIKLNIDIGSSVNQDNTCVDNSQACAKVNNIKPINTEFKCKNDTHYVSFTVATTVNYGFRKCEFINQYIVGIALLLNKNKEHIFTYEIDVTPEFKYKKFIRDKVKSLFNYKNKDIIGIKAVNLNENFHNYLVLIQPFSSRNSQYKNQISDISSNYTWKQYFEFYPSKKIKTFEENPSNETLSSIYSELSISDKVIESELSRITCNNSINNKAIYKAISEIL